jgi:uncharacterized membrane protein YfcA
MSLFGQLQSQLDSAAAQPVTVIAVAASIFAAAVLRGLTGFGFAIAVVPLLSLTMPPVQAVPLVVCLQLVGNLIDARSSLDDCHWPSLRWLMLGAAIGSPLGVVGLSLIPSSWARLLIATATGLAVATLARGFALGAMPGVRLTVPVGVLAGLFNGLAAMPGPPVVAYYMATPLRRDQVRSSLSVFFLLTAVIAAASAVWLGLVGLDAVAFTVAALPLMFIGTRLGRHLFTLGTDATHRRIAVVSLLVIAVLTFAKGVAELLSGAA